MQLLGDAYSKLKLNESITASCANATGEEAVKLWDPTEKPKDGEHSKDQDAFQETSLAGLIR